MAKVTVDDALRLITDPRNRAATPPFGSMVEMRARATVGALEAMGADVEDARSLVAEAARRLGGTWRLILVRADPLAIGQRGRGFYHRDDIWVPESALRQADG